VFAVRVKQAPPMPVEYVPASQLVQSSAASLPVGDEVPAAQGEQEEPEKDDEL